MTDPVRKNKQLQINLDPYLLFELFPVTIEMNITRGCKQYSESDDDFEVSDGEDLLAGVATLACASDLCNSIDGHLLSASVQEVNAADPGENFHFLCI